MEFDIVFLKSPSDGSCFFHCLEQALEIKDLRRRLREYIICNEEVFEIDKNVKEQIMSSGSVDSSIFGFVSKVLHIFILVLMKEGKRYLIYPAESYYNNEELSLLKKRDHVVLYFTFGHYDLVGTTEPNGKIKKVFSYDDSFIKGIKSLV
ncbi:MAG: hypothetical protein QW350_04620 [Candidatus Aenigmatarchaeota archaeon]|jgi:hypothetical protein